MFFFRIVGQMQKSQCVQTLSHFMMSLYRRVPYCSSPDR